MPQPRGVRGVSPWHSGAGRNNPALLLEYPTEGASGRDMPRGSASRDAEA